jgi:hypothetical protein
MAQALITHVQAAKTWLHGMEGLPNYLSCVEAQKQYIAKTLAIIRLGLADSAAIVSAVRALPFKRSESRELLQLVGERTNAEVIEIDNGKRRQQNFEAIADYYTREMWERFMSDDFGDSDLMEAIVYHPMALGMTFPTEGTHRVLASIYLACTHGVGAALLLSPIEKNNALKTSKKTFKQLKGKVPICLAMVPDLHGKPAVFRKSFPDVCARVYVDAKPFPCPVPYTQMVGLQATIDCRSTAKGLRGFTPHAQSHGSQPSMASAQSHGQPFNANNMMQFFQMMAPMVRQMSNQDDAFGFELLPKRKKLKLEDGARLAIKPIEEEASESNDENEAAAPAKSKLAIAPSKLAALAKSQLAIAPSKLSAVDALARIQAAVQSRVSILPPKKNAKKSKTVPDTKLEEKAKKSKILPDTNLEEKAKKSKIVPESKSSLPISSKPSSIVTEGSRSQVLARTGTKGKGQSKSFRFGEGREYADEETAKAGATKWLANF